MASTVCGPQNKSAYCPVDARKIPSPCLPSEKTVPVSLSDDPTFYALTPGSFDIRESFRLVGLLMLLSPLGLNFLTFRVCTAILVSSYMLPFFIRLRYPRFMEVNILEDLNIYPGALIFGAGFLAALQLQFHNPGFSIAFKFHPKFYTQPLIHLVNFYLCVEIALNGSSEEKEMIASWLRWIHRHIGGTITAEMKEEFGIPDNVKTYGYTDELNASIIYAHTWSVIAFQTRFGRPFSKRAKDATVLAYTYAGLRMGIPMELLSKDYESFVVSFNHHLKILDAGCLLTSSTIENAEASLLSARMSWISKMLVRAALMIGFDLLPKQVREKYRPQVLNTSWKRAIQRVLIALVWFFYPVLMWLPLRGLICLFLVLEPQLRPFFTSSLEAIHSMDIHSDIPVSRKANPPTEKSNENAAYDLPSYFFWLKSGMGDKPFLQVFLMRILEAQLRSAQATKLFRFPLGCITPWMRLPDQLVVLTIGAMRRSILDTISCWRTQMKESLIFKKDSNGFKMPRHIGIILDGNRRFARRLGKTAIFGHQRGTETTAKVFEWWLRFIPNTVASAHPGLGPQCITLWTFSTGNLKRPQVELDALFSLMTAEFKTLALSSIMHLFQVRVRCIGSRDGLPRELIESMELLEESTKMYSRLFLQFAVGYGGREEIVHSVKHLLVRGGEITEDAISEGTFCAQIGLPPVDLIVRTSEHRTSGFFLWDTQAAELHFINKLWPEFTVSDWLDTLASFSKREIRGGK